MRCMRGARSLKAVSIRVVHRSGGSNTWESDEMIKAFAIGVSFISYACEKSAIALVSSYHTPGRKTSAWAGPTALSPRAGEWGKGFQALRRRSRARGGEWEREKTMS